MCFLISVFSLTIDDVVSKYMFSFLCICLWSAKEAATGRKLVSKWHPTTKGTLRRNYRVPSKSEGRRLLKAIASLLSDDDHFVDATSHKVLINFSSALSSVFSIIWFKTCLTYMLLMKNHYRVVKSGGKVLMEKVCVATMWELFLMSFQLPISLWKSPLFLLDPLLTGITLKLRNLRRLSDLVLLCDVSKSSCFHVHILASLYIRTW